MGLLRDNADTDFGHRWKLGGINSVDEFRARVPLSTYEDYQQDVDRIRGGGQRVLTRGVVKLLEPTSGSTAPTKLIPYTEELQSEFGRAIAPWIVDLLSHDPALMLGQAYWSISSVAHSPQGDAGAVRIGFEDDSHYLGRLQRNLIRSVMAVPTAVREISDMETFRYVTLLFLLRSRSLSLISVWHPTFLTLLMRRLSAWLPRLAADIASGRISAPAPVEPDLLSRLGEIVRPDPARAAQVESAFRSSEEPGEINSRLWPRLRLISCWTDASATHYVPEVARLFPQARVQGKGLIATEGIVSFPKVGLPGSVLAVRSHFFEFLPVVDDSSESEGVDTLLAHELETGGAYSVVVTTGGGLYRYKMHDVVRVVGHVDSCPLVRFEGKESNISDRFGEKLSERHVRKALDSLQYLHRVRSNFAMVGYEDGRSPAYTLFIEADRSSDRTLRLLAADLDAALQENYHYRYCRDLGQLDAIRAFRIERNGLETYFSVCQASGQRAGDVKTVALHQRSGWSRSFDGNII